MKKNKFIYSLSAIALACIISFSGVGNSYIQVHATSVGIEKGVWNDDVSAWENIRQYIQLFASAYGIYVNPSWQTILWGLESHNDFYNFMISDGYSEEEANDCVHGGGGHVRDGISVDDNGNVTYSDEVSDLFHGYIKNYLDSNVGYCHFKTLKAADIGLQAFTDIDKYNNFVTTVDNLGLVFYDGFSGSEFGYVPTENIYCPVHPSEWEWYVTSTQQTYIKKGASFLNTYVLYDDWSYTHPYSFLDSSGNNYLSLGTTSYDFSDLTISTTSVISHNYLLHYKFKTNNTMSYFVGYVSSDGCSIKVWYDLEAFKAYSVGRQPYYVNQSWLNYNSSDDNSITLNQQEYQYYFDNSTTIYQNIQNNIDNGGDGLTEKDVQNIVDSAVQDMKDDIANSGNNGSGDNNDSNDGGNGIGALVDGIGKLLDTILSLIGRVMGVVADFTQSILDLFSGFTDFTDGFSSFLSGAFSFIPQEIWNVIQVGLSLMILLAVIKFLRK